jgi:hypothetical protein
MTDAMLAYGRVTGHFARRDDSPTIEEDAVTLAAEVQRLTFLLGDLHANDRQISETLSDLLVRVESRAYR